MAVGLEKTGEQPNLDAWHVVRWNCYYSKAVVCIMNRPGNLPLAFNLKTTGDAFQLNDGAGRTDSIVEIVGVWRNGDARAGVPDDGANVGDGTKSITETGGVELEVRF